MANKILKVLLKTIIVLLILFIGLGIYFYFAIQIDTPSISGKEVTHYTKKQISSKHFQVEKNWLKQNQFGLWELYIEGNAYERGYANGMLTKELHDFQEEVFIKQIQKIIPDLSYLNFLKYFVAYFNRHLPEHITKEYQEEIFGISQFASDKYDFIAPKYHRILNYHGAHDIGHALQDKNMTVGCTSFAVWNQKSEEGELLIGRNFDFYSGDDFAKNKIVQFTNPTTGYKFATVTWAGFIGACSGMNEKGLTVTINASKSSIPTKVATPIALLAREILQYAKNIEEAVTIAEKRDVFVSESILIGSATDGIAISIEKSPENMGIYESLSSNQIICPNHYQGASYQNDLINLNNQIESSSLYRNFRLKQLLKNEPKVNYKTAASILRNQKGINDKNIGLTNEKSLNQLLAHHGVIFKPKQKLMWVSANPFQCGEFVCYNLDSVFQNAENELIPSRIDEPQLLIEKDSFLLTQEYRNFLMFKKMKESIQYVTKNNIPLQLSNKIEEAFIQSNPESYYTYQILGDYYFNQVELSKAKMLYEKALTKVVATLKEEKTIREQIEKCNEKLTTN
jgi:isopenicillin-N N-acyltransferase like protein